IVGDVATGAEAGGVRPGAPEDVDPLGRIVADRVVLGQGELRPARGRAVPVGSPRAFLRVGLRHWSNSRSVGNGSPFRPEGSGRPAAGTKAKAQALKNCS